MPEELRVLLIEDCEAHARMVELLLGRSTDPSFELTQTERLADAFRLVHDQPFDVALMDLGLPDSQGLDAVKRIRSAAPHLPIVVLTASNDEELALQSISHGAQEFLSKEMMVGHLLMRVIRHSIARQKQLISAQAQALTDELTGIANRRSFDMELQRRIAESQRSGIQFGAIMFDVDYFKKVNDVHGHEAGDEVLRGVAKILNELVRVTDLAARIGGEEFALIAPVVDVPELASIADRARQSIGGTQFDVPGASLQVTISAGVAMYTPDDDAQSVMRRADQALYQAKSQGRNRVVSAESAAASV